MAFRTGLYAGLIASLVLLGACQREPESEAFLDEPAPPPAEEIEAVELAGGPSEDTRMAARQAADDAFVARLEARGLMVTRRMGPDGRMVMVISNRPVPNPVLFGGKRRHARAAPGRTRLATIGGGSAGRSAAAGSSAAASSAAGTAAAPTAEVQAPAQTAARVETAQAAPAAAATAPTRENPVQVADPARAGFEMSPMMWGVLGLILAAILAVLFMANRPRSSSRPRLSGHQAPPEASGGAHA